MQVKQILNMQKATKIEGQIGEVIQEEVNLISHEVWFNL